MEEISTNRSKNPNQRGFSFFVGDKYIGYMTIKEFDGNGRRVLAEGTAVRLAEKATFENLMSTGHVTVKPYEEKAAQTISIDELLSEGGLPEKKASEA